MPLPHRRQTNRRRPSHRNKARPIPTKLVPKPSVYPSGHLRWLIQPTFVYSRADAVPAQNQNQHPQPISGLHYPQGDPCFNRRNFFFAQRGVISPSGSSTGAGGGGSALDPVTYIPNDYSVTDAWFPSRGVPSLCFFKRKVERLVCEKNQQDREPGG